jgi:hypothetical protein
MLERRLKRAEQSIRLIQGKRLSYAFEIREYGADGPTERGNEQYETDLLISEDCAGAGWKPRVVIEAKLGSITTHDAITYSEKAATHKRVHPYLRYGILIGDREHYPLPGRLYRHGVYFDFMLSWVGMKPTPTELRSATAVLTQEVHASRQLEEILYSSRSPRRKRYTVLHRPLVLK